MSIGLTEVPYNRVLHTIQNMSLHSPGYFNALGKEGRSMLRQFLITQSYETQKALEGINSQELFGFQFQAGDLVTPSFLNPFIEIIAGPGINEGALIKSSRHNLKWLEQQTTTLPEGPLLSHDIYTICRSNDPSAVRLMYDHTRIPERILNPMANEYMKQPITNRGPVQELLLKRTLALEGKRVPYKYEMETGFDLDDLNMLLAHTHPFRPYLVMLLETDPPVTTPDRSELLAQKIRLIKDLMPNSGKLSQRIALTTVPIADEGQEAFDQALTFSLAQLRS